MLAAILILLDRHYNVCGCGQQKISQIWHSTFTYTTTCLLVNRVYKTFYLPFLLLLFFQLHFERPFLRERKVWVSCVEVCVTPLRLLKIENIGSTSSYGLFVLFLPSLVNRMHCANRIKIRYISVLFVAKEWWSSDCMLMREC